MIHQWQEDVLKRLSMLAVQKKLSVTVGRQSGKSYLNTIYGNYIYNLANWSEWRETISLIPRKSINGKYVIGRINKRVKIIRSSTPRGFNESAQKHRIYQYATNKELFEWKLRGKK